MNHSASRILQLPGRGQTDWVGLYLAEQLATKDEKTQYAYALILHDFTEWLACMPGSQGQFAPRAMTKTAVKTYFDEKKAEKRPHTKAQLAGVGALLSESERPLRYAPTTFARMKVTLSGFAFWLIEHEELLVNPVKDIVIPRMAGRPPRVLRPEQRFALKNVVERVTGPRVNKRGDVVPGDLRGAAIFALGYYAGCRVSDVSHLQVRHTHVGPKVGWVRVGYKRETYRDLDLLNEARRPLHDYLEKGERKNASAYVFTSQREKKQALEGDEDSWRLTEDGIHQWFQEVRLEANVEEAALINDITFHDLRHDFGHRLRQQGWSLEEIAYYLGHVTASGEPSIQTTVRYTQVGREQVKEKLQQIRSI